MIAREHKAYILMCDTCGEVASLAFPSRIDAANFAVAKGWQVQRQENVFTVVCPKCKGDKPHGR